MSGAVWALTTLTQSLSTHLPPDEDWNPKEERYYEAGHHRHHKKQDLAGGPLLWNMGLRLLIHIIGDLHQPLHTSSAISRTFPNGDQGGGHITVKIPGNMVKSLTEVLRLEKDHNDDWQKDGVDSDGSPAHLNSWRNEGAYEQHWSLHSIWDSALGIYTDSWPVSNEEEMLKEAEKLMAEVPPETFGNRLKSGRKALDFHDIANDSHDVAVKHVYNGIDFENIPNPLPLSEDYIKKNRKIAREQLALGGYRLSKVLEIIVEDLEAHEPPKHSSRGSDGVGNGESEYLFASE